MSAPTHVVSSVKAKLDAMTAQGKGSKSLIWRPTRGKEEQVRIVPYRHGSDPFSELYFHYDIGPVKTILCPHTAGVDESCPICDYTQFLYKQERSDKNYALYKRLKSRQRTYVPVIVRGDEDAGIRFWGIGKNTYTAICRLFIDAEYGDLSDPLKGRDLKVLATNPTQQYIYGQVDTRPAANGSPLSVNPLTAKQWIVECPLVFEAFTKMTTAEIQSALDVFIAQGDQTQSEGTEAPTPASTDAPEGSASVDDELADLYASIQQKP
jgi:gp32 DNA binding protein like